MLPNWALLLDSLGACIDNRPFNPLELVLLPVPLCVLHRRGKSAGYLVCFSLFSLYLWAVVSFAVCPLPIDPEWIEMYRRLNNWGNRINLVPTILVDHFRINDENTGGNLLMGMPFGFALPFVAAVKPRRLFALAFAFALGLELIQLLIGLVIYRFPYRSVDVDDVILVFLGSLSGYGVLRVAAALYRRRGWSSGARVPVWSHFHWVLVEVGGEAASGTHEASGSAGAGEAGSRS